MEPEGSLACLQHPATGLCYPVHTLIAFERYILISSSNRRLGKWSFPFRFFVFMYLSSPPYFFEMHFSPHRKKIHVVDLRMKTDATTRVRVYTSLLKVMS
jgi:hypothetical protein